MLEQQFIEIVQLIQYSRNTAIRAVNVELINLYWNVGAYINKQLAEAAWGEKTVDELADFIQSKYPDLKGFNRRGLYRMKQFYETYSVTEFASAVITQIQITDNQSNAIVSSARTQLEKPKKLVSLARTQLEISDIRNSILTQLSWTHHRTIFSRCKTNEEREFYIKLCIKENYSVKELERQISSSTFERAVSGKIQLSPSLKTADPSIAENFKDTYIFEFLNLPETHSEEDLQKGLIKQMKHFILEIGKDFLLVGENFRVQVGSSDFFIDILFYHRSLQCLVAFELKADKFKPANLGQLNFYLEALDRDVKKPNENPSIGILLSRDNDNEVVEYALSRSLSPTMVAEYKTQLPDKKLLQEKLHELFEQSN